MRTGLSKQMAIVAGVVGVAGAALLTGCAPKSTATSWQPNGTPIHEDEYQPWWSYKLIYHPNSGVYFEPYSHTWHWQEHGEWRSSKTRPGPVAWRPEEAVVVKMNWDTPEYGHASIAAVHPRTSNWDRLHPITLPADAADDTALTSASESAGDSNESETISMGVTPNKSSPSVPDVGATAASASEAEASESSAESSTVAGVSGSSNPE